MNSVKRIFKNSGASLITQISAPASSFVLVFIIARFLGASGLGKFSSALALLYIFQALASLGLRPLITREVAQDKTRAGKYLINASFLGSFFSVLIAGIMCLTINLITKEVDTVHSVYILSVSLVPYTLTVVCQSINRAFEQFEYITISVMLGNIVKLVLGLFILFKGYGIVILMIALVSGHFISFFLSLFFALRCIPKQNKIANKLDFDFCRGIVIATPVFALILICGTIRSEINIIMLASMMSEMEVGIYSAANKLVNICKLGITGYIMAIQPVIFMLFKSSPKKFQMLYNDSVRYFFILILPIIAGATILSDKFILIIFKEEFLPSVNVFSILIWLLILYGFNQIFANVLIASNHQKVNLNANIIGMIGNIFLNLLLIPMYGFIGAAIASVASTFMTLVFQYVLVSKHLFRFNYLYHALKPFAAAALMGGYVQLMKESNLILTILTAVIVYVLSILALKTFSSKDMDRLRKLLKRESAA